MDKNKLDIAVEEASEHLEMFCQEKPQHGPLSLACFIIVALCPLSRRWLFMEHTAQGQRLTLSLLPILAPYEWSFSPCVSIVVIVFMEIVGNKLLLF